MTSEVHRFEAREGGAFAITLTYDGPTSTSGDLLVHQTPSRPRTSPPPAWEVEPSPLHFDRPEDDQPDVDPPPFSQPTRTSRR